MNTDNKKRMLEGIQQYRQQQDDLAGAEAFKVKLAADMDAIRSELRGLDAGALASYSPESGHFDEGTRRKIQALSDLGVKLELLPGVILRTQAEHQGAGVRLKQHVRALLQHYRELAEARAESARPALRHQLSKTVRGGIELLEKAVSYTAALSDDTAWERAFASYYHKPDPADDAEGALALAEAFDKGEACPDPAVPHDLVLGMEAARDAQRRQGATMAPRQGD